MALEKVSKEARHLQMFYSEMLRKVKPNTVIHYHAIIHSALKYAVKTDMLVQKCGGQGG